LFVLWSVTTFTLEVPSGAWADAFSRRRLLAAAGLLRAVGFALWVAWPSYPAFAAGFLLWGASSAMQSGTAHALLYDELAAVGRTDRYVAIAGRGSTVALISVMAATALATPAYAAGGYPLLGAASVAVCLAYAVLALSFPETSRRAATDEAGGIRRYAATLRAGLHEVRAVRLVRRAVLLAAVVPGLTALDEYRRLTEARMQAVISGPARATVLSVAGFGAEVAAVAIYLGFGVGATVGTGGLSVAVLVTLAGVPLLLVSLLARRWLPAAHAAPAPSELVA
jgi:MFS family permease